MARSELLAAIRRVSDRYMDLPESSRPDVNAKAWQELEHAVDHHCARGERDLALAAIERWEAAALRAFEEAAR